MAAVFHAFRLGPGEDLRGGLEAAFAKSGAAAGFLAAAVGSLSNVRLRPAGRDSALVLAEPLEIVALSGTFSPDGAHLHVAVSDASGVVTGGHLLEGATVRTTAEIVLGVLDGVTFRRVVDPATGYRELTVTGRD
ncbi:PPC domain-containing DNA-binding protein [Oceaniglobus roseus]|uniref:PPC domain-containing DNA-binding protein n=1 Tax=Oceaniglobus roseus TaxID=1737570 RepID=UPI000C7EC98C|nr:PPC domain-containing DNA-binding protein [Kandeliimicrobium roseum]